MRLYHAVCGLIESLGDYLKARGLESEFEYLDALEYSEDDTE